MVNIPANYYNVVKDSGSTLQWDNNEYWSLSLPPQQRAEDWSQYLSPLIWRLVTGSMETDDGDMPALVGKCFLVKMSYNPLLLHLHDTEPQYDYYQYYEMDYREDIY